MSSLEARIRDVLSGSVLEPRVDLIHDPFVVRRGDDAAAARLGGANLVGLARALASSVENARFLAHRPGLLERIATAGAGSLRDRSTTLRDAVHALPGDLEGALDALRLLRRDETLLAAVLLLGGIVPIEEVSWFLSEVAEEILGASLRLARASVPTGESTSSFAVLGMGKVGGREFTFHSDLDLIFLCRGTAETVATASRVAQRLTSYLATRTGAGVAYAVDSRLRPSGNQGLLVTTFESFDRYQQEQAQTWEHLALMRARAIAGDVEVAGEMLAGVRASLAARELQPWPEVATMRRKVEAERGGEGGGTIAFKTGPGGLMDVDFLAAGATLERGTAVDRPRIPANAALLRAAAEGEEIERVLAAYADLRRVEASVRWVTGRASETLETHSANHPLVVALLQPTGTADSLATSVTRSRRTIRSAFGRVVDAGSVQALVRAR